MNLKPFLIAGAVAIFGIAGYTWIGKMPMNNMDHNAMSDGPSAAQSTKGFEDALTTMMQGMMGTYMEQSRSAFTQMQEQMQKNSEQMMSALGLKR